MTTQVQPWYREPWPWLLMAGPFIVILAGIYTTMLAISSSDGLVTDDYYKEGLAINRSLQRDARAQASGTAATAHFGQGGRVRIALPAGTDAGAGKLRLQLLHPTRAGMDQVAMLRPLAPGLWEGVLPAMPPGNWQLQLDAPELESKGAWRIVGRWSTGAESAELRPAGLEQRP
jgi:hypothetical protein